MRGVTISTLTSILHILALVVGLFVALLGLFTILQFVLPLKAPADTSNRINRIRLWWFALTHPELSVSTFSWMSRDELENVSPETPAKSETWALWTPEQTHYTIQPFGNSSTETAKAQVNDLAHILSLEYTRIKETHHESWTRTQSLATFSECLKATLTRTLPKGFKAEVTDVGSLNNEISGFDPPSVEVYVWPNPRKERNVFFKIRVYSK